MKPWTNKRRMEQAERARKLWKKGKLTGRPRKAEPKPKTAEPVLLGEFTLQEHRPEGNGNKQLIPVIAKLIRMLPDDLLVEMVGRMLPDDLLVEMVGREIEAARR